MGDPGWLSSPLSELHAHYTVVVVGSGYGAAIAASRLARAGQSVCVLERGRELHPGDFPRSTETAAKHVQLEGAHEVGDRRNLYDFHVSEDMTVFSGCGLGGTSLINANVALRPEDWVLDDECWPAALRDDRDGLNRGYAAATTMLAPTPYPDDFPPLAKVAALKRSAGSATWYPTPITVTFRAGPNAAGVHQEACTGCGDCTTGCNYGAKNTLLMNYLPDAVRHGAAVFTEVEVERVEPRDGRWAVVYRPLGVRDPFHGPAPVVTADVVMLGAGTLGSTAVLLRSRDQGLPVSEQLGHRFTGNGDVLGFSYGTGHDIDGVGAGPEPPSTAHPAGPCITSVIDERGDGAGADGIVIEDAVIPGAIGELVPLQLASQALPDWLRRQVHRGGLASLVASLVTRGRRGALRQTQTFLVMGHDDDEGRLVLDGDRVRIEWRGAGTSPYYERVDERLTALSAASGGTYLHSPVWSKALRHELITVHPLGGCPMADTAATGVVDERGRVFAGRDGTAVHDGLYVCDGAIVPRPLGVNPLLTISALAERIAALAAADRGWTVDDAVDAPADEVSPRPTRAGLRFTEQMAGWFASGDQGLAGAGVSDVDTFRHAAQDAETADSPMRFVLTLTSDDLEALTAALDTPMRATGTVEAPALDGAPLTVDGGQFQLFAADDPDPAVRHMWYRLPLVAADGRRFFFEGFKTVEPGVVTGAWAATTTLYVTVHRDDADGPIAGRGILRIAPADFAKQLRTMTVTGPVSERRRVELLAEFQKSFAGLLVHEYGTAIRRSSRLNRDAPARRKRPLRLPPPEVHPYRSLDGVDLRLTRYQGGRRGPVVISHGLGANPLTFSTDLIETNAVEYLVAHGFDVWIQEWRGSTLLPTCYGSFTADDVAHADHPAAEATIRELTGRSDLHWVTHCVGSITIMMSTLAGTTTPASIVCSAAAAHPIGPAIMKLKVKLNAAGLLRAAHVRRLSTDSFTRESLGQRAFDAALRLYPIPKEERCDQAVCRRLAFIYGIAVHHAAVNDETHVNLHELFGTANLEMLQQLAAMAGAERLLAADRSDAYLPHLERLQLPITFLHGAHNLVWVPESTRRTYDLLVGEFGPDAYRRVVFDDHGHQDAIMGAHAVDDVFPVIVEHLDRAGA